MAKFVHPFSVHVSCTGDNLPPCTELTLSSALITIDWQDLRTSFVHHYRDILLTEDQISRRSHEDLSICHDVLWTQLQLLMNGIASGSIIVDQANPSTESAKENRVDEFELQYCVRIYDAYLSSGRIPRSVALEGYQRSGKTPSDGSIMYDWALLMYITATTKASHPMEPPNNQGNLLSVQLEPAATPESHDHSSEMVSLAHIRDSLGLEMNVTSDPSARHLMMHLHALGLFRRIDRKHTLFASDDEPPSQIYCAFPLPLLLDTSVDVETLVAAIEACLKDIHVSVNETAFLLLTKRCWPNIWVSDYGLARLAQGIISWVFTEVCLYYRRRSTSNRSS